jgi:hypothetical protein
LGLRPVEHDALAVFRQATPWDPTEQVEEAAALGFEIDDCQEALRRVGLALLPT